MSLQTTSMALNEALHCIEAGDIQGARFFISEAHDQFAAFYPLSAQAAHLASVIAAEISINPEQRA